MKAVLDANVLASGFVRMNPRAIPTQLVDAWRRGAFELVVSEHLRSETLRAFRAPYFRERLSPSQVSRAAAALLYQTTQVEITSDIHGIATHPEDDLVVATAVSAAADYLVTGDKKLQELGMYEGVRIISPRAFMDLLRTHSG
jgi:putative PIN family toxin of toxin-antitoxin system